MARFVADVQPLIRETLLRCCRLRHAREDVTQNVCIRLLEHPDEVARADDVLAYVARVTRNEVATFMLSESRRSRLIAADSGDSEPATPTDGDDDTVPSRSLEEVVEKLSDRHRAVLEHWRATEAFRPTAARSGLDVRQVKRCLSRIAFEILRWRAEQAR